VCTVAAKADSVDSLAIMVVMGTVSVLVIALLCSILDARLESRTAMLAKSLETANHELMLQALHDNLTKLPNRTLLEDRVTQAIHKAKRVNASFALMFIDLDGFKAVNDSLGHHIGDLLLIEMASRIRSTLRQHDTVARLGGDEFVVLVEPARPEDAAIIAEKIIGVVNQPFTASSHQLKVSASIGISVYPIDGKTYRDLAINADAAMYHTKRAGRNGFHFFEASMNIDAANQLNLMLDLGHALEQKQLKLFYQPKFRASSGELIGAEALLRWQHPTRGMIPPDQFIPLAEKSGLIIPIGDWVLNEACQQMREWHDAGHTHLKVAVNLSPQQFNHQDLVQMVQNTLLNHHLPSSCLILEITESTAMHNVKASLEILQQIADLGVDISIDDFGTGYSSLLYLKRLPANELKIDRGFINNLSIDPDDAAIVSAIIALGHTLNLRIVAEGVETTFQQSYLMELGCDTLQGYLLGKPMPAGQLSEYLLNATAAVPLAS
jgi:diguanylate cyclase (GGDEF)-like protein